MPKRDMYGRSGDKIKVPTERYRRSQLERTFLEIDRELNEKNKTKTLGARELVIMAYKKRSSKEDAYLEIKVFNEKVGTEVYTKEVVDKWILEYQQSIIRDMLDDEGR